MAGYEFACNGAALVHGCDIHEPGIKVAREIFADIPNVEARFEVVDLSATGALRIFGDQRYDFVLLLAITHKLRRQMKLESFMNLLREFADRSKKYIGWRGYANEMVELDRAFVTQAGFDRIQYSEITESVCPAAIWRRRV